MPTPDTLERTAPFSLTREAAAGDGLTLEGYAAVFDTPTRIDSWEGTFDEKIKRGAFAKTIKERTPVIQFDHGRHPMVGSIPLGSPPEMREDAEGLYIRSRLHDNWLVVPVRDAIASDAIDGMSFRFGVVKDEWRDAAGKLISDPDEVARRIYNPSDGGVLTRTLLELRVPELGPVVFPAYPTTSVGVRSRELAEALTDPEVRADLARIFAGTPVSPSGATDAPGDDGAAVPTEPGDHSADNPRSDVDAEQAVAVALTRAQANRRALRLAGVIK